MNHTQRYWNKRWVGIDPETFAFCARMAHEKRITPQYKSGARDWFISCQKAGLSTSLNADLDEPKLRRHLDEQLQSYCYPGLEKKRRIHMRYLLNGLKIYTLAKEEGLRTRSIPQVIVPMRRRWDVSPAQARAKLPAEDQRKLEQIEEIIDAQAERQWSGQGAQMVLGPDGRKHKATTAVGNVKNLVQAVGYFLRHALVNEWTPFTLEGLLTPDRVTNFLYYSKRYDGGGMAAATIENREGALLDFFYRGRTARPKDKAVVVITDEQDAKIRAAMAEEQLHRSEWNISAPSLGNTGRHKWYPEIEQVNLAIQQLEDQLTRADARHARGGMTEKQYWRELRDTVLTLCTLFCMWRVDTAATGSLLHLRHDPVTDAVVDDQGFAIMENIARAKNMKGDWYPFVPELLLPPNVLRYLAKLLKYEGRSLEHPLRDGEEAVQLKTGDRWGADRIPSGELTVVPIFRRRPHAPEGLGRGSIQDILENQLARLHFGSTNPHTLRAAGAIYWSFIQEMPDELVMSLGLWEDSRTLKETYAHMGQRDLRLRMARYIPVTSGVVPPKIRGRREKAASDAVAIMLKMLEKPTNPYEATRWLTQVRRPLEEIERTIAADLGKEWEAIRPDRFESGELETIDEALRGAKYPKGIASVLGRDVFARDVVQTRADLAAKRQAEPLALRRARAETTNQARLPKALPAPAVKPPRGRAA